MKQAYVGVAILFVVGLLTSGMFLLLSHLASAYRPTTVKGMPYESGIDPLGDTRERYSVKFYIVAMLFIVFDIETIFFLPWAVIFRDLGLFGLIENVHLRLRPRRGPGLRVEEGCAGVGLTNGQ